MYSKPRQIEIEELGDDNFAIKDTLLSHNECGVLCVFSSEDHTDLSIDMRRQFAEYIVQLINTKWKEIYNVI